jgi:hypothetical protein
MQEMARESTLSLNPGSLLQLTLSSECCSMLGLAIEWSGASKAAEEWPASKAPKVGEFLCRTVQQLKVGLKRWTLLMYGIDCKGIHKMKVQICNFSLNYKYKIVWQFYFLCGVGTLTTWPKCNKKESRLFKFGSRARILPRYCTHKIQIYWLE